MHPVFHVREIMAQKLTLLAGEWQAPLLNVSGSRACLLGLPCVPH